MLFLAAISYFQIWSKGLNNPGLFNKFYFFMLSYSRELYEHPRMVNLLVILFTPMFVDFLKHPR